MSHRILASDNEVIDLDEAASVLADVDADVVPTEAHTPDDLVDAGRGASGFILDARMQMTRRVIEALDELRVIGRAGIGVDNVDVEAAAENGVTVTRVPDYSIEEVSTHAMSLLLASARRLSGYDRDVRAGGWDWTAGRPIHRLRGRTLGLVAFGKIARRVAEKVAGFDLDVIAYDEYVDAETMGEHGVEKVDFDGLLSRSDLVSIHAPLTDETRGLFDRAAFDAMSDGVVLVNTARGPIVDEDALYEALTGGRVAAAGLDVFRDEPPGDSPLLDLDTVTASPHAAWYSEESRLQLTRDVAGDVARVLRGEEPRNPVDPESGWF